jgi:hypothetical protein
VLGDAEPPDVQGPPLGGAGEVEPAEEQGARGKVAQFLGVAAQLVAAPEAETSSPVTTWSWAPSTMAARAARQRS